MTWPITSDGMRSGVNWTRVKSRSKAAATVLTSSVLATPGTPSSSTWPPTSSAATSPDRTPSWPTTTLATSSRTASTAARASAPAGVSGVGGTSAMGGVLPDLGEQGGHLDELVVGGDGIDGGAAGLAVVEVRCGG